MGSNATREERRTTKRLPKGAVAYKSLSGYPSFMEKLQLLPDGVLSCAYSRFRFEPLHIFPFGTLKVLKEFVSTYLRSGTICSHPEKAVHKRRVLGSIPMSILRTVSSILEAVKQNFSFLGHQIDFPEMGSTLHLNRFFLNCGVRGMPERKDCPDGDIIATTSCRFFDRVTVYMQSLKRTRAYKMYS